MLLKIENNGEIDISSITFNSASLHKFKFVLEFILLVTVCNLFILNVYRNSNNANFVYFEKTRGKSVHKRLYCFPIIFSHKETFYSYSLNPRCRLVRMKPSVTGISSRQNG